MSYLNDFLDVKKSRDKIVTPVQVRNAILKPSYDVGLRAVMCNWLSVNMEP